MATEKEVPSSLSIFSKIEMEFNLKQPEDWDEVYTESELISLTNQVNSSFPFADYLDARVSFTTMHSDTGWTRRTYCPFHKRGNERTASLFVNAKEGTFYCHACGARGGIVEYISMKFGRPNYIVANYISSLLNISKNKSSILLANDESKAKEKKRVTKILLELSDTIRQFLQDHKDDDDSIEYVHKVMEPYDVVIEQFGDSEKRVLELVKNIKAYISIYDKKKKK